MSSLYVISDQPALHATLASELPGIAVHSLSLRELRSFVPEGKDALFVMDNVLDASPALLASLPTRPVTLVRPIRLCEALYRIRALLQSKTLTEYALGHGVRFRPQEQELACDAPAQIIPLTEKESALLQCLFQEKTAPFSRETLLQTIWGYGEGLQTHTLETHIYRLRGKLKQAHEGLDIQFSSEEGYRIVASDPPLTKS